jgi:cytochrome c oxidase subunit 2
MRGYVMVDSAEDYQTWLGEQSTFAELSRPTQAAEAD